MLAIPELLIDRFGYTPMGTFGRMTMPGFEVFTLEEVWRNNQTSIPGVREGSCIPVGTYKIRRGDFPTHKDTFEVLNVPGRTAILIHIGNTVADIEGCIAPGLRLGALGGVWGVLDSGLAYTRFMAAMHGIDEALLTIRNHLNMGILH